MDQRSRKRSVNRWHSFQHPLRLMPLPSMKRVVSHAWISAKLTQSSSISIAMMIRARSRRFGLVFCAVSTILARWSSIGDGRRRMGHARQVTESEQWGKASTKASLRTPFDANKKVLEEKKRQHLTEGRSHPKSFYLRPAFKSFSTFQATKSHQDEPSICIGGSSYRRRLADFLYGSCQQDVDCWRQ